MAVEILDIEQIIAALKENKGFINLTANKLGVSVSTINNYKNKYPEIQQCINEQKELFKDMAEHSIMTQVLKGNSTLTIFYAKTQMKDRGYVEDALQSNENININVIYEEPASEEAAL
jgi:hypothetical protein